VVRRSPNAIQLAFFDDSLVRFIGIFNPVLVVIAFAVGKSCVTL
jgi:hypothetical protein